MSNTNGMRHPMTALEDFEYGDKQFVKGAVFDAGSPARVKELQNGRARVGVIENFGHVINDASTLGGADTTGTDVRSDRVSFSHRDDADGAVQQGFDAGTQTPAIPVLVAKGEAAVLSGPLDNGDAATQGVTNSVVDAATEAEQAGADTANAGNTDEKTGTSTTSGATPGLDLTGNGESNGDTVKEAKKDAAAADKEASKTATPAVRRTR